MQSKDAAFDLVLSYPQWQGSGRSNHLGRGADAALQICAYYGPTMRVPPAGHGERRAGINHWTAILEQFRSAQAILEREKPRRVLTAGGDCACDIAVIDYLNRQYSDLTVIWIDAHLDANTPDTSPSGDFHGMPVASLLGAAPPDLAPLLGRALTPSQFRYVAAHRGDAGEWEFQQTNDLSWLAADHVFAGAVHIHFDLDALDPTEFPHVAYPEGKLSMQAGLALVSACAASGRLVGLTITEFAPVDAASAEAGSVFLRDLCEAATAA